MSRRALRSLLLLGAALVCGFAVGRLTAPEERGRGGEQRAAPVVAPPLRLEDETSRASSSQVESQGRAEPASIMSPDVVHPTIALEEPGREGLIEVDFEGYDGERQAWVGWRSIQGAYESWEECPAEEGSATVTFTLEPGIYDVWWLDGQDGRRRGTRASVESRRLTRLRATDHCAVPPVPDGLGVLDLEVAATWGGAIDAWVDLTCLGEGGGVWTNARGHGSAALYPGRYALEVGDHREEAEVVAGRVTSRRIAHVKEGDLLFENTDRFDIDIGIGRRGEGVRRRFHTRGTATNGIWMGDVGGAFRRGFVYLAEGEYDVLFLMGPDDTSGFPLGRAVVRAGQTTWFRYELPRGGLALRVILPNLGTWNVRVTAQRIVDGRGMTGEMVLSANVDSRESRFVPVLPPGRYVVTAAAGGCESERVEVDVADQVIDVTIDLAQER